MKYLKTYNKLSESIKPEYNADWKRPGNPVREELEFELREIFLEITDLGYRPQLGGFVAHHNDPYVWICNKRRKSHDEFWNDVSDTVERIKDYLTDKGFKVNQEILNEGSSTEQIYIYFDEIS
jgi:hypothetical protein